MNVTPYSDVNRLLNTLLTRMQSILHDKLVGLYLYGSLVTGDFDHDISDIDLLTVTSVDIDELEFEAIFQKSRGAAKRLQDLSYQISKLEEKANTFPGNKKETLLKLKYLNQLFSSDKFHLHPYHPN